jgi:hypothetical protein
LNTLSLQAAAVAVQFRQALAALADSVLAPD